MKIALFAAVEAEVMSIKDRVHLTGIGRECAMHTILSFMKEHEHEDFTVLNIGTAGAHTAPIGSMLRITEIVSGGSGFLGHPMLTDTLPVAIPNAADGKLFSSDCFVSPHVYSADFLKELATKADCFDMESSALYSVTKHFGKPYVSYKIISDHLDVDIATWQHLVNEVTGTLCNNVLQLLEEIGKREAVELL
jgi:aldehyde:ferredoxin oxidoreductase